MSVTRELLNRAKNMGRLGPKADGWPAVMSELHDAYIALLDERDRLALQLDAVRENLKQTRQDLHDALTRLVLIGGKDQVDWAVEKEQLYGWEGET